MVKRNKTKKNARRCACCGEICSHTQNVVKADHAVDYVKKLGYSVVYLVFDKPLTPEQYELKREMEALR